MVLQFDYALAMKLLPLLFVALAHADPVPEGAVPAECALDGLPSGQIVWDEELIWLLDGSGSVLDSVVAGIEINIAKSFAECKGKTVEIVSQLPYSATTQTVTFSWDGKSLSKAEATTHDPAAAALERAWALLEKGDFEGAKEVLGEPYVHRVVDPNEFQARLFVAAHKIALQRFRAKNTAGAVEIMDEAFGSGSDINPCEGILAAADAIEIVNNYGFFLGEVGRHEEALEVLEEVLEEAPDRAVARLNIADSLWALGKQDLARQHYGAYAMAIPKAKWPKRLVERCPMCGG